VIKKTGKGEQTLPTYKQFSSLYYGLMVLSCKERSRSGDGVIVWCCLLWSMYL